MHQYPIAVRIRERTADDHPISDQELHEKLCFTQDRLAHDHHLDFTEDPGTFGDIDELEQQDDIAYASVNENQLDAVLKPLRDPALSAVKDAHSRAVNQKARIHPIRTCTGVVVRI